MTLARVFVRAAALVLLLSAPAAAQPPSAGGQGRSGAIVGSWVGEVQGQGGMVHGADQYIQRVWGRYDAQRTAGGQVHLSLRTMGFLPKQICAQAPGFPVKCRPNQVPATMGSDVNFSSPNAFQINGVTMTRANGSPLLQAQVPSQLILGVQAPVQPHMVQPVAPSAPGHYTPTGPGSVQAMHADDDQQQYRICAVNGGQVLRMRDGSLKCIH
jgi:hypothetical protein